jgi:zinc transport system substrate-binding protein
MNNKFGVSVTKFIAVILIFSFSLLPNCKEVKTERTKIIATTSLIGTIVKAIGKDRVDLVTIIPAGMCPGHFDLKPGDMASMYDAKVLLSHGWEEWMTKLVNSIENKELITKTIDIEENWMIPDIHKKAASEIANILSEVDFSNKYWHKKNLDNYKREIDSVAIYLKEITKNLQAIKVICSNYQADFLSWLGLDTIATYGRPEELTPKELTTLIEIGKKENVQIVIDNLQSSSKVGKQIAEEIGAAHVILTNFPLGNSYVGALKENVEKILKVAK